MKVSASIYANPDRKLEDLIQELEEHAIDMFHVDCNDDSAVFQDIETLRKHSKKLVDLHIIAENPTQYFELIETHKPDFVTFQFEQLKKSFVFPKIEGVKFGLSIIADTPNSVIDEYINDIDFVLFMATIPGQSGGSFDKRVFRKIKEFQKKYPNKKVHVDGGVNGEVSFILRNMGVDAVVSGSYLFKFKQLGIAMLNIKANHVDSKYKIADFMWGNEDVPKIREKEANFAMVLQQIEKFNFGFALIVDEKDVLKGIVTNADVRRALLQNLNDLNAIKLQDLLNTNPILINENKNVVELLKLVKKQSFPITVLPVIDNNNKLTGVVTFFNLIKGEL
jgi:ribulose-phosphate 3-epimerase